MTEQPYKKILEVGDRVKMDIDVIASGDMDGVEFTSSGTNYWAHMLNNPDGTYTVESVDFDFTDEEGNPSYTLSDQMKGNTWYRDELILLPAPKILFEKIKEMTLEEMSVQIVPIMQRVCKDGIPTPEEVRAFLSSPADVFP